MHIGFVTCLSLPEPDVDEPLLLAACAKAGLSAEVVAWDDASIDWSRFSRIVVRSTWDYHLRLEEFLSWLARVERVVSVSNPPDVMRSNVDKRYLLNLQRQGVPVVPTVFVSRGDTIEALDWDQSVVKPTVSGGSYETYHCPTRADGVSRANALAKRMDVMIQPYIRSVETSGERSLIWIDGELTHAIRKNPRFADGAEHVSDEVPIEPDERDLAAACLSNVPGEKLYARIDLMRLDDGRPVLSELELVEPSLFLKQSSQALDRLVAALAEKR